MNKRKVTLGLVVLLVVVGAAWAFGLFGGADPAVAELQQMGDQMWNRDLPDGQRDQLRDDFRQRMQSMTDQQRDAFFDANRDQWMGRMEQRMDEFFAMSQADQQKRLDEMLDRMRQPRTGQRPNPGGGDRGGWANLTEAQRDERSKRRLDRTSPKIRAQFTEFRRRLDDRAKQRGVNPPSMGGWGGRRGGA